MKVQRQVGSINRKPSIRTIPLFKLLPGRPRSTFFSSSFFLGGILLRSLVEDVAKLRALGISEEDLMESTNAG